jgi:hypothetical protein
MARGDLSLALDCAYDLIDAAEFIGDEYLAAILRKAAQRISRQIERAA